MRWENVPNCEELKTWPRLIPRYCHIRRSQRPHGLRHELSKRAHTLVSWVRIQLKASIDICAFILSLCCPVCRLLPCDGLVPVQGALPNVYKTKKLKKQPQYNNNHDICVLGTEEN
jgi:hypothetical protein